MKTKHTKQHKQSGAALILVVVVTVLLAVIGVMFMMTSRLSEMETKSIADQRDLNAAVDTVVSRINEVLVEDLFGADNSIIDADSANVDADESYDYPRHNPDLDLATGFPFTNGADGNPWTLDDIAIPGNLDDYWLASLEPVWVDDNGTLADPSDDVYIWRHITDLWGTLQVDIDSLFTQSYDTPSVRWVDPDDTSTPSTWDDSAAWNPWRWQVSADNVEAKIISPKDPMDIVAIVGGTIPASLR